MNNLENAFGAKFTDKKDNLRTRTFEMGGHTFRVKVPLTSETEAMFDRVKNVDEAKVKEIYDKLAVEAEQHKGDDGYEFKDDDIIVNGRSLKKVANGKVLTENRITELVRLLVPENKDFDMASITYADIEELFPFSIQMDLVNEINNVISPGYSSRGK